MVSGIFSLRRVGEIILGVVFLSIWLPRTFPSQDTISLFWPIYHWYGIDYYYRTIDAPGVFVGSILVGLSTVFARDYIENSKAASRIPVRIHVTGIRGKSTTTRLIGAALRHSGLKTITKTTGKEAVLTDESGVERKVRDHKQIPNLREQQKIIAGVGANGGADAIVFECMSIRPRNIEAERRYVRPTISVITNVREDHIDTMGPTLDDVARSLSGIIPRGGVVVTAEKKHLQTIKKRAEEMEAKVVEVDESAVPDDLLQQFPYMVFKENIAIALEVSRLLGISFRDAIDGMLEAGPDPGLTRVIDGDLSGQSVRFITAFGVNDVDSTRIVFAELERRGFLRGRRLVGFFHGRDDRVTRTLEFAELMAGMPFERIICVGKTTNLFASIAARHGYPRDRIDDWGTLSHDEIFRRLESGVLEKGTPVALFGCGNLIGIEGLISEFEKHESKRPAKEES